MECYINSEGKIVRVDKEGRFVYESMIYIWFDNIVSMNDHKWYFCYTEIKNVIESYYINNHIELYTVLYSAPKDWLIENGYNVYIKPEKKKRKRKVNI